MDRKESHRDIYLDSRLQLQHSYSASKLINFEGIILFDSIRKRKEPYNEQQILNDGLELAMAFGSNFLKPIQPRLAKLYPNLSDKDLEKYNDRCQCTMKSGTLLAYEMFEKYEESKSFDSFLERFKEKFPWVSQKNLKQLYSTGKYFAKKDGL